MAEDFYLDPHGLKRATTDLRSSGNDLSHEFAKLAGVLADNDECWGTDDIGKAFAKNYVQSAGQLSEGAEITATNMVSTADTADEYSTIFQGLDHESAEELDRTPPPSE
jgi:hypothetical protein